MAVFRRFTYGGHLHLPDLDETVECKDNDVVLFDGQANLHGVTPITTSGDRLGWRFSVVFYQRKSMCNCLPYPEERARAARRRTEREVKIGDTVADR